jgi:hypothetical protein
MAKRSERNTPKDLKRRFNFAVRDWKIGWPIRIPQRPNPEAQEAPKFLVREYYLVETLLIHDAASRHREFVGMEGRDEIEPLDFWDDIKEQAWRGNWLYYFDRRRRILAVSEFEIFRDYSSAFDYTWQDRPALQRSDLAFKRSLSAISGDLSQGCDGPALLTLLANGVLIETSATTVHTRDAIDDPPKDFPELIVPEFPTPTFRERNGSPPPPDVREQDLDPSTPKRPPRKKIGEKTRRALKRAAKARQALKRATKARRTRPTVK